MNKTNLYWQVYKNLEREFLALADVIHIDDNQLENVYSMRIADLLTNTAIEVESISKHLYIENGGKKTDPAKMYFDTDCLALLNKKWKLESKVVLVVSPNLFLEKDENLILTPLKNSHFKKEKSASWEQAYQDVKHDRANALKVHGRLIYLLQALAALFVLNLYNRNEEYLNTALDSVSSIDLRFGSELFAVKLHRAPGLGADGVYHPNKDYDECIYIQDYEAKSKKAATDALSVIPDKYAEVLMEKYVEHLNQQIKAGNNATLSQESFNEFKKDFSEKNNVYQLAAQRASLAVEHPFLNLHYDIVLNKNQYPLV